ncbi:putative phage tail protein [Brucella sp. 10RB9215]|uniref:putative phage tail protein n=1 Tax=Brucella sp. 10RB9215 TaxID=1149953 RepID=UPI001FCE80F0|nr:putative phage tail protein [Brucella sp. 10RB9215]
MWHTIEIEEFWPSKAGVLRAGQALIAEGEQFTWRVKLQLISEWIFRAGVNTAGQPLGGFEISDIECELRRLKPAHTQLVFSYQEN